MPLIHNTAKAIIRHPLTISIRNLIDVRPTYYKSIPFGSCCSDLFLWISDKNWATQIDLMNLTNLCFPKISVPEIARVILFDRNGTQLTEDRYEIDPGKFFRVNISELAQKTNREGLGTFVVLREMSPSNPFIAAKTCLSERGYISYTNVRSGIKQFVHGNSYVLYTKPGQTSGYQFLRSNFVFDKIYRIQTPLNDCISSECIFVNPTNKTQLVKYVGYNAENAEILSIEREVQPLATDVITPPREVNRLESVSKVFMLRPVVRKNYKSGSDFFHA